MTSKKIKHQTEVATNSTKSLLLYFRNVYNNWIIWTMFYPACVWWLGDRDTRQCPPQTAPSISVARKHKWGDGGSETYQLSSSQAQAADIKQFKHTGWPQFGNITYEGQFTKCKPVQIIDSNLMNVYFDNFKPIKSINIWHHISK